MIMHFYLYCFIMSVFTQVSFKGYLSASPTYQSFGTVKLISKPLFLSIEDEGHPVAYI